MKALMFLTKKKSGEKKGQVVYNGKPTIGWLTKEEARSPREALESIILTATIDAHEKRDAMMANVLNAFILALMPTKKNNEDRVIMKITGSLVEMLRITPTATMLSMRATKKSSMLKCYALSMVLAIRGIWKKRDLTTV